MTELVIASTAYQTHIERKRKKPERYCEHPECKYFLRWGEKVPLHWSNDNPYCGACLKRLAEEKPHESIPDGTLCSKGHAILDAGTTRGGGCLKCSQERRAKEYQRAKAKKEWSSQRKDAFPIPRLREIRESKGLSRREVANACGRDIEAVKCYENKGTGCIPVVAARIADFLGVDIESLRG